MRSTWCSYRPTARASGWRRSRRSRATSPSWRHPWASTSSRCAGSTGACARRSTSRRSAPRPPRISRRATRACRDAHAPNEAQAAQLAVVKAPEQAAPTPAPTLSFRERGRVRRRLRYVRRVRELQLRDLGGLVFELRRFGREREDLVAEKVSQLAATD